MKTSVIRLIAILFCISVIAPASAQFNLKKAVNSAAKAGKALTLSDADMAAYVKESVDWMDKHNPVLPEDNPYTQRLRKLTEGITDADGIPLNFKVYDVIDINAFACPDGSVRVFSSLMDIMNDDELMGIIGHEIGHVVKRHSKNAFRTQLLTGAMKDAVASTGGKAAALTESQLGTLGEALINSKYSQKQETEADDYGFEFCIKNNLDPYAMYNALNKLLELSAEAPKESKFQKMFSSHPDTAKRVARAKEKADEYMKNKK